MRSTTGSGYDPRGIDVKACNRDLTNRNGPNLQAIEQAQSAQKPRKARKQRLFTFLRRKDKHYIPLRFRVLFPHYAQSGLLQRSCNALWPWRREGYPGKRRLMAWLIGLENVASARTYGKLSKLPKVRLIVLADRLETKARELLALAQEAREQAERMPGKKVARNKVAKVAPPVE